MLIDTHCHLDQPPLLAKLADTLTAASICGVNSFIVPGIDPEGWWGIVELASDSRIFAAPGIHPMRADRWNRVTEARLLELIPASVAIGEIGLDYTGGMPAKEVQKLAFREQLRVARGAGLPVIIHCRKAFSDTLKIIREENGGVFGGVMHAFSGSSEIARECIDLGLKIGVAGSVTWESAVKPVAVVKSTAIEQILLESDAPDMTPAAHRGESNQPAFLTETALMVAGIKSISLADVERITSQNARSVFNLP